MNMANKEQLAKLVEEFNFKGRHKAELDRCPLCDTPNSEIMIAMRDRYGIEANISMCSDCGIIYFNPQLHQDEYDDFYSNYYRRFVSAYWETTWDNDRVIADQREYASILARFLVPKLPKKSELSVLDIGGSTGEVCSVLAGFSVSNGGPKLAVTVVDPNLGELELAGKRGYRCIHGTIEEVGDIGKYDLALICRSIDHSPSPKKMLKKALDSLSDDGFLYVDYVDTAAVIDSEGFSNAFHVDHPVNFTDRSFSNLALDCKCMGVVTLPLEIGVNSGSIEVGYLLGRALRYANVRNFSSPLLEYIRQAQTKERKEELDA